MACPECGGRMKVISFIEPPQGEVIERILRHCGLWRSGVVAARGPPGEVPSRGRRIAAGGGELRFVDKETFWATF